MTSFGNTTLTNNQLPSLEGTFRARGNCYLENGADIKAVAQIMGHADSTMLLKVYQHIKISSLKMAVEVLGDIL